VVDSEIGELRRALRRGRRTPYLTFGLFLLSGGVIAFTVGPARLHESLGEPGTLWARLGLLVGLIGVALTGTLLAYYLVRLPVIRHANALEKNDPSTIVFIGAGNPNLGGAIWSVANLEATRLTRNPAYFCVEISQSGITFWSQSKQWLNLFDWNWDRVTNVNASVVRNDGTRGSGITRPALILTTTTTPKVIVQLPVVVIGRGLAGCFAQPLHVIELIAKYSHHSST
jgi:hypothetical protein